MTSLLVIGRWAASALACAAIMALVGAAGVWTQEPWLVPSLGASILLPILSPRDRSAAAWNVGIGQLVGLAAGFAAVYALAADAAPDVASGHPVTWIRVAAAALAIGLAAVGQGLCRATNPAGGATALIVALGKVKATTHGAFLLLVGIALVTALGEGARLLMLRLDRRPVGRAPNGQSL